MIVIFGASSDLGRRTATRLLDVGLPLRLVAKDVGTLDARAKTFTGGAEQAETATEGAEVVISCAHARHTRKLLRGLSPTVKRMVLTGSAWRYSAVPDPRADEVRDAEMAFCASGRNGAMLHPTMIYGGTQENNLRRLFAVLRRSPIVPLPGGGKHRVQPVHIDDVVASLVAAARRDWHGPTLIPIAGPRPLPWREMVAECVAASGSRRVMLPVPLAPAIAALKLAQRLGFPTPIEPGVLERFRENTDLSIMTMQSELGVSPRDFKVGVREAFAGWSAEQFGEPATA